MMKTIYNSLLNVLSKKMYLLVLILCMIGINESKASHATGGEITYQSLGNGQYLVTFTFYRDCFGIPAPTTQELDISSASCNTTLPSVTLSPDPGTGQEITHACSTTTSTCATPPGNEPGIQEWSYSAVVTLPLQCPDWQFSTSVSSRNAAVTTIQNPDFNNLYVDAYLNNTIGDNNSPQFTNVPIAFECIGQTNIFNQGVIDPDGDSLVYFFIAPRSDANTPLIYNPGYSVADPIVSSPPVSINAVNGDIIMNPTQPDVASVAVQIFEYRNGVIIGSVMRDMQIYIVNCTNTLPTLSGINGSQNFNTSSCIGGSLCFDVISGDADAGQNLTMTWNQAIPGATFNVTGPATSPVGHFCWAPTPADARPQPYTFTVIVRDDACPSNGTTTSSFNIVVSNMSVQLTSTPSVQCFGSHNGSATAFATGNPPLTYIWTPPSGLPMMGSSISHLSGGNYTLNVTDGNGCVGTQYFTIAEPPALVVSVTPTNSGCGGGSGGSALATVTGGTGVPSYLWSNSQTVNPIINLNSGTYSVVVTDAHSCTGAGSAQVIAVTPVNFTLTTHGATCLANDGSATVTHTGGTGPFSYHWTPDIPGDSTTSNLTGLITGGYSVIATDLGSGCAQSLSGIVANLAGISATITASSDATCETSEDGSATVSASGGIPPYIYLWPNGDTTATTTHLGPGTYLAMVEDYNGCRAYASVTIGFVNPSPAIELGPDTMPCIGFPFMMDAGPGFSTYLWSDNSTNQTLTVTTSGIYSVLVTNSFGCQSFDALSATFVTCMVHNNNNGTHTSSGDSEVSIYPNPTNNEVNVNINRLRNTDVTLTVSDILGNSLIFSKETSDYSYSKKIDIHTLPAGIYMLKVEYNDEIKTLRIVKQ